MQNIDLHTKSSAVCMKRAEGPQMPEVRGRGIPDVGAAERLLRRRRIASSSSKIRGQKEGPRKSRPLSTTQPHKTVNRSDEKQYDLSTLIQLNSRCVACVSQGGEVKRATAKREQSLCNEDKNNNDKSQVPLGEGNTLPRLSKYIFR